MLKVGWVIGNLDVHGSVRRVVEMSNALVARGHWVTIYTGGNETDCAWLPCAARIAPLADLQHEAHDALIFAGAAREAYGLIDAALCRVRALYVLALDERHLDDLLTLNSGAIVHFRSIVQSKRWLIMANATWEWEWLRTNLRPDTQLLLGGVNRTIFHRELVQRDPLQRIVLTSGRKRAREGSGTVAEAVKLVQDLYPMATWKTYAGAGLSQDEMRRLYCSAEVFADGQWYAGWNNPVVEAMACECPVVCTDIGGVRDFAQHEETALLVPVGDVQAMARAIARLFGDPALAQRLAQNALRRVETFTYAQAAERLESLIKERLDVSLS